MRPTLATFSGQCTVSAARLFRAMDRLDCQSVAAWELYLLVDETKLQDRLAVMVVGVAWEVGVFPGVALLPG
ncbi:MAG: hypothetical protein H6657_02965 [Ardenticatenaceae bacterium]|nr:hypothetical protein [Ardenticatenaceae bacterium]